ncbi:MAG: GHMP kinase [Deltaproteobacteria bacterium]|nr:MAG: GHMP kinase [Deltaproteobacteria bacterium]
MIELFVPGRLCLFGEHSDWAGGYRASRPALAPGYCLVAGTDQGLTARLERRPRSFEIASALPDGRRAGPVRIEAEPDALEAVARSDDFMSYAAGVAAVIRRRYAVGGLFVEITRADLPIRKGLSSSAALCVLVARAYSEAYGLMLSTREEMELAYAGERLAGSECGRMDQVCAYGRRLSFLTFDGSEFDVEPLEPGASFELLIVDLRSDKDTRRILTDLNACFPDTPGERAAGVREALGRCNAELLARARRAVGCGDAAALGALMREAQALFDAKVAPASAALAAPRLRAVLTHTATGRLAYGGKGVGSQGDGCAQLVTRGPAERAELSAILERELGVRALPLTLRPSPAAG